MIASIAERAGSRGSPEKPVPRIASTITAAPSSAGAENGTAARAREPLEVGPRVTAQLVARREHQHVDVPAELPQPPGHDEAVAAVVALAADDGDAAVAAPA